jgi:hypothetical protein
MEGDLNISQTRETVTHRARLLAASALRVGRGVGFASLLLVSTVLPVIGSPGDLDAVFAGTGKVRTGFGFGDDYGHAAVVQADRTSQT